ncbi:MAG: glycerol-3-phosphate dehydrogenase [Alphaproteobacteria bacterium]|nr:glycerol-3-phosphate dehydrogenase [Alphaproteobacteria bacterium]
MNYDLCIIGGGINGVGIARDAAGRGLKVLLLEQSDLGSCTSSNSSKMIHGGLRYLEFYEFGLVRKSLVEREIMMRIAPQIVSPLRLCIPHRHTVRPAWMVRLGLFFYDHLTSLNLLPKSKTISLSGHSYGHALKNKSGMGFIYSDCWVDDARLVILNAMDARSYGADIRVSSPVTKILPVDGEWHIHTPHDRFRAKIVVNATGPYVRSFLDENGLTNDETPRLRLVQGSHIIVPRLYDGDHAYLIQCPDKRVVFVLPYEKNFTLIGTTETAFKGNPKDARITNEEIDYLCKTVNREFEKQISKEDILWTYSGVRPLFDEDHNLDNRKVTRDYKLVHTHYKGSRILNIFGGKLTTYRTLSEEVVDSLLPYFPNMNPKWTDAKTLPFIDIDFQPNEQTIRYFIDHEWARTIDDVLWRRTKWGLHLSLKEQAILKQTFDKVLEEDFPNEENSGY